MCARAQVREVLIDVTPWVVTFGDTRRLVKTTPHTRTHTSTRTLSAAAAAVAVAVESSGVIRRCIERAHARTRAQATTSHLLSRFRTYRRQL